MEEKAIQTVREEQTPTELIQLALNQNADLGKLKELLSIKKEYEADEARKAYHRSMAEFKANPPRIDKDKEVSFATSSGRTSYKHATLANITDKISQELSKYGLSASWRTKQNGAITVTCRITHTMGHFEETELSAAADTSGAKNSIQAIGSTITYLERYTLLALTGLATFDQDDDSMGSSGQSNEPIDQKQLNELLDWISEIEEISGKKPNMAKFCEIMGIQSLETMPKQKFSQAVKALEDKKNGAVAKGAQKK